MIFYILTKWDEWRWLGARGDDNLAKQATKQAFGSIEVLLDHVFWDVRRYLNPD